MIICSCNVLTDGAVRALVQSTGNLTKAKEVYGCLGCSAQCGKCARNIKALIREARIHSQPHEGNAALN